MRNTPCTTLEEAFECYGRGNLVAIDFLPQIIHYVSHGCQPRYVSENEYKPGKITCWFLKDETRFVYKKWMESSPRKKK